MANHELSTDRQDDKSNCVQGSRKSNKSKGKHSRRNNRDNKPKLDANRSNNPNWYYANAELADQVSQLAFQNLAGYPIVYDSFDLDVPNIVRIGLNPSPGVQTSKNYNTALSQNSAINMSGFKLYTKLSAFTGRTQNYAPQDVSTMILAFGEPIAIAEFIRRAFGVAYTMNMRNRDYPRQVLEFGMKIDATDLFANLSNYRTRFNTIMTLFNTLPVPKNVAYFDKCASLYERIFLDSPSSMAQTLVPVPTTTWVLDESSYSGGSILKTTEACIGQNGASSFAPYPMSHYLNLLETQITTLLNSSTLQVIYTDVMNFASKQGMEFWRMDYLLEGYSVMPQYDTNFLIQMHNATVAGSPVETQFVLSPDVVTPNNDVYPDPNKNCLYYNPAMRTVAGPMPRTGSTVIIDMPTDNPSLTDRVECTRYSALASGTAYTTSGGLDAYIDTTLPDHYVTGVWFEKQTNNFTVDYVPSTLIDKAFFADVATLVSNIAWAPRFIEVDPATHKYTGRYTGDVNFYTTVDEPYLRKLHDFCGLALYDVR